MKRGVSLVTKSVRADGPRCLLLSVGCNHYDHAPRLDAAVSDAESVFTALVSGPSAFYDPEESRLLSSPTRLEFDECLRFVLQNHKGLDAFALYFAGHGQMQDGSFYLCPSDASMAALSVTAINVSQVLRAICELRPRHGYLILDACFSGGAALDLPAVLRSDILDRSPTFGISVLASAHSSKGALETAAGGVFTSELLRALRGELEINDTTQFLGLGEIVRKLRFEDDPDLQDQAPNFWDLNLTGPDVFCINPLFKPLLVSQSTGIGTIKLSRNHATLSGPLAREVWQAFLNLQNVQYEPLFELFGRVVAEQLLTPGTVGPGSAAMAQSFVTGLQSHEDSFAPLLIRAAMVRALMSHIGEGGDVRNAIAAQLDLIVREAGACLDDLECEIDEKKYRLLSARGGLSDLYYFPLRVSQILGWVGFLLMAYDSGIGEEAQTAELKDLVRKILSGYGNSIVAIGDDQSPYFLSFLAASKLHGLMEEAQEVIGRLYLDFNENFGRVLVNEPTATEIIDCLLSRDDKPWELDASFIQNPCELFSVIMLGAALFELDDVIDDSLIQLDRTHFAFYVPQSFGEFWQKRMETGRTVVFQLGHGLQPGNGIWTVNDMRRAWRNELVPLVDQASIDACPITLLSAHLLSLIMPDRLAWSIVPVVAPHIAVPRPVDRPEQ